MESNKEQTTADIEKVFEDAKAARYQANMAFKSAKGKFHSGLVARRSRGETLTIADMKALEDSAVDLDPSVQKAYLEFIKSDGAYRIAKVNYEEAKRKYWDGKDAVKFR